METLSLDLEISALTSSFVGRKETSACPLAPGCPGSARARCSPACGFPKRCCPRATRGAGRWDGGAVTSQWFIGSARVRWEPKCIRKFNFKQIVESSKLAVVSAPVFIGFLHVSFRDCVRFGSAREALPWDAESTSSWPDSVYKALPLLQGPSC